MDTMEITKIVGASCGALLIFLLIGSGAEGIYHSGGHGGHGDDHKYGFEIEVAGAEEEEAEEEVVEIDFAEVYAVADASAGESVFRACRSCHKLEAGANGVGPYLHGVVGRPIGAATEYGFSDALGGHGGEWTPENLNGFLENPKEWAPGTKMAYRGLKDVEDRANLIAYLATIQ